MSFTTTVPTGTFSASGTACQWCGYFHSAICPRVRSIEYYNDGSLKRVEFDPGQLYHGGPA